ncbi:OsmC family protein [Rhizobium halophytocola]|uniref:Osmotically inducible protein OsmC n=1 Tax=Rhizobium halophytocola TaxID=735519 RepID=A0ABS4E5H1_9HYPH|nr:OsmC family protein [Rhizobium halophytocola]MBP1853161.1 osmotically inducible protein OsmC [Rhizobium halophytocola]
MAIKKYGSAEWNGGLKDGKGKISTESGALKAQPYGFNTRFDGAVGTNPEELIGAAHAACFSMALSKALEDNGQKAESIETKATVSLEQKGGGFEITGIALSLKGVVPGLDEATFKKLAEETKSGCPVSKALSAVPMTLDVTFG